ncbi:hypothetical protein KR084_010515 [Drosophila pseudotakahashii]|nr:hypothetical protein KR084_010515 [Drosophila pseudotakahashii]
MVRAITRVKRETPNARTKGTKETSKRYREKMKEDPIKFLEYRAREAERSRLYRKNIKEVVTKNKKALKTRREIDRVRQQKYREKKKEELASQKSIEEMLRKVERALPAKLSLKIEIIKLLYSKYVEPESPETILST